MASVLRRGNVWIAKRRVFIFFPRGSGLRVSARRGGLATSLAVSLPLSNAAIAVVVKHHRLHAA
jgi:hypothetical protein